MGVECGTNQAVEINGEKVGIAKAGILVQQGMKSGISWGQYLGTAGSKEILGLLKTHLRQLGIQCRDG